MDETLAQLEARLGNVETRLKNQSSLISILRDRAQRRQRQNPDQEVLAEVNIADFHCWLTTDECNAWNEHVATTTLDRDYDNNRIEAEVLRLRLRSETSGSERDRLAENLSQVLHKDVALRAALAQEAKQWYAGILQQRKARGPLDPLGQDFRQIRKDMDQAQAELDAAYPLRSVEAGRWASDQPPLAGSPVKGGADA